MGKKAPGNIEPPAVSFKEVPAGRETLAAIAEDRQLLRAPEVRGRATTKHYGDRISNAPGAVSPKVARALDTSPDVSVTLTTPGRETYAVIHHEHRQELPDIEVTTQQDEDVDDDDFLDTLEIERVFSFAIRAEMEQFRSLEKRAQLVERRLARQIPGFTADDVTRIELKEGEDAGSLMVRVYTRVLD